jgi:FAD:protein FMN transferase
MNSPDPGSLFPFRFPQQCFSLALGFVLLYATTDAASLTLSAPRQQTGPSNAHLVRLERSLNAMGTTFTIDAYGVNLGALESATEQAFDDARKLDQMLSNYIPDSELSQVNRRAAQSPVRVSREFFDIVKDCIRYSRLSEGTFDITVGPLMKIWGFYKGTGHLPHQAEIRTAQATVGFRLVNLDEPNSTVRFSRAGVSLDPGGVGKGLAVDRMASTLRGYGITSALISAGGSSVYGIGTPPTDSKGWAVSIRNPRNTQRTEAQIYLNNSSVSTSGNYEKFFWSEGKLYSHIMDPRTGYPSTGMLAVSVVAPKTLDSEVWAKPYYIRGRAWTMSHKSAGFRVLLCEDKKRVGCEWLQ